MHNTQLNVGLRGTFYDDSFTAANTSSLSNPTNDCFEAFEAAGRISTEKKVVKCQVHAGGRGKAGGALSPLILIN